jgi:hypothetical protein
MKYYIDPSFTRTGIFITDGTNHRLQEIKCLEKIWVTKVIKGKEVKRQVNEPLVDYHDAFRVSQKVVKALSDLFYEYPPDEVNIETPGIRGMKIERFLWGLSFQLVEKCLQYTKNVFLIPLNSVGNAQRKFLQSKEFCGIKLTRSELKKLARRGRSELVKKYMDCKNIIGIEGINDDKATAVLFWFFQKEFNLIYKRLEI